MTELADDVDADIESVDGPADSNDTDSNDNELIEPHTGPRWRRITWPQVLMAMVVVVYVAYFTRRSLDIHHALGTASYDSALYDQGVWLLSRFETPFVTLMLPPTSSSAWKQ